MSNFQCVAAAVVFGLLVTGKTARNSQAIYSLVYDQISMLFTGGLQTIWPLFIFAGWFVSERGAR